MTCAALENKAGPIGPGGTHLLPPGDVFPSFHEILTLSLLVGLTTSVTVMAADHAVTIVTGGINLYSISKRGVDLQAGSPFALPAWVLEAEGDPSPLTPVSFSINPKHDFVAVVYQLTPYVSNDDHDVIVVGYAITEKGLTVKWTWPLNMDPDAYPLTTVATGNTYTILLTAPDPGGPNFGYIINNDGDLLAAQGSPVGPADELLSLRVDEDKRFYYSCRGEYGVSPAQTVSVYSLEPAPPTLILTSSDPSFIQSECE
jgi:hypothetical protein